MWTGPLLLEWSSHNYLDNMLLTPESYPKLLCGDAIFKVFDFVDFLPHILH